MSSPHTISIRLDLETFLELKKHANRQKRSANSFVVDAIKARLKAEQDNEWREGFEAMGRDSETRDVEYMIPAAGDIVFKVK